MNNSRLLVRTNLYIFALLDIVKFILANLLSISRISIQEQLAIALDI
ncbi:hypothetical protein [Nodularia chucula]